jgi:WD40 repeat protein
LIVYFVGKGHSSSPFLPFSSLFSSNQQLRSTHPINTRKMPPPPPKNVFRYHSHPVHSSSFATDNNLLYAGDEEGWVSITDLKSMRVLAHWKAHEKGVLGVSEWMGGVVR